MNEDDLNLLERGKRQLVVYRTDNSANSMASFNINVYEKYLAFLCFHALGHIPNIKNKVISNIKINEGAHYLHSNSVGFL